MILFLFPKGSNRTPYYKLFQVCKPTQKGHLGLSVCAAGLYHGISMNNLCKIEDSAFACSQKIEQLYNYDLHKHSKLQKLEHRRVAHLRNLIFKRTLNAPELQAVPRRSTRANDGPVLVVAQPKNELFKKSVHYKGGILWNELDGEIRNINDLNTFKRKNWLVMQW